MLVVASVRATAKAGGEGGGQPGEPAPVSELEWAGLTRGAWRAAEPLVSLLRRVPVWGVACPDAHVHLIL